MSLPEKGELEQSFTEVAEKKSRTLYHSIPVTPQGDSIRASDSYGMTIPQNVRTGLGLKAHDENYQGGTPLVFASEYIGKALAFGLQAGEKIFNKSVEGTAAELVLAVDRDKLMSRERDVTVFSFPDNGFMDLAPEARQSVSAQSVPFSKTQVAARAKNAEDLMRAGLQIFTLKETFNEAYDDPKLAQVINGGSFYQAAAQLIKEGRLVWENQARGINPHPVLAEKIGVSLAHAAPKLTALARR